MSLFYRVEHPVFGFGPYRVDIEDDLVEELDDKMKWKYYELVDAVQEMASTHDWLIHPTPHRDTLLGGIAEDEYCGFSTIQQFKRWFNGHRAMLRRHGFKLFVYDIPESSIRVGRTQSLARLKNTDPIKIIELTTP